MIVCVAGFHVARPSFNGRSSFSTILCSSIFVTPCKLPNFRSSRCKSRSLCCCSLSAFIVGSVVILSVFAMNLSFFVVRLSPIRSHRLGWEFWIIRWHISVTPNALRKLFPKIIGSVAPVIRTKRTSVDLFPKWTGHVEAPLVSNIVRSAKNIFARFDTLLQVRSICRAWVSARKLVVARVSNVAVIRWPSMIIVTLIRLFSKRKFASSDGEI